MVLAQKDSERPDAPDWREECAWLGEIAWARLAIGGVLDAAQYARLRRILDALDQPEQSRPSGLPDLALAQATIDAMKAGEPIDAAGIKAVVEAAEMGIGGVRSFDLRWKADQQAIERWRAGDLFSANTRELLAKALAELRGAASHYADHPDGMGQAYRECSAIAAELETRLKAGEPGHAERELIWPDHADLVVWLLGQLDREAPFPPIAEVGDLLARLARAVLVSGGNSLAIDSRKMIDRMAQALQHSERQRFSAEAMRRQLDRHLAGVAQLLGELYEVFREREAHYRAKIEQWIKDEACGFCGTEGWGSDHDPDCPSHPNPHPEPGKVGLLGQLRTKADRNSNLAGQISATLELIGHPLPEIGIRDDGRVLRLADSPSVGEALTYGLAGLAPPAEPS